MFVCLYECVVCAPLLMCCVPLVVNCSGLPRRLLPAAGPGNDDVSLSDRLQELQAEHEDLLVFVAMQVHISLLFELYGARL